MNHSTRKGALPCHLAPDDPQPPAPDHGSEGGYRDDEEQEAYERRQGDG